jgi:hypothetical protein
MTFTLSFAGIAIFLAGGAWQFFLQRKQNGSDEKRRDVQNDLVVSI